MCSIAMEVCTVSNVLTFKQLFVKYIYTTLYIGIVISCGCNVFILVFVCIILSVVTSCIILPLP